MAKRKIISPMSSDAELRTQQAADLLNVSKRYITKLLEQGSIPSKKVGSNRRILLKDLLNYNQELIQERERNLQFLAQQAQELNMGY